MCSCYQMLLACLRACVLSIFFGRNESRIRLRLQFLSPSPQAFTSLSMFRFVELLKIKNQPPKSLFPVLNHKELPVAPWIVKARPVHEFFALTNQTVSYGFLFSGCKFFRQVHSLPPRPLTSWPKMLIFEHDSRRHQPEPARTRPLGRKSRSNIPERALRCSEICYNSKFGGCGPRLRRDSGGGVGLGYDRKSR